LCGSSAVGGDRHAELGGERVIEELVVGAPPEGIVDHAGTAERGVLEVGAVERNVVGDPVDDHVVSARLGHPHVVDLHELSRHARHAHGVHPIDERAGKRVLHAEEDADFFMLDSRSRP